LCIYGSTSKVRRLEKNIQVKKSWFERSMSIFILIIIVLATYGVVYWNETSRFPVLGGEEDTKIFYVTAFMWEYYPQEIRVQEGDYVIIHFSSIDVTHGLYIEAWNITSNLAPNQTETIEFKADKIGKFEFYCIFYCGIGHEDMKAYVVVEEKR